MVARERVHVVVSGRVQGVYFRAHAQKQAIKHCLSGYVRNLDDGDVEIEAEGEMENLLEFVKWTKHGPPNAYVEDARIGFGEATGEWRGFEIKG